MKLIYRNEAHDVDVLPKGRGRIFVRLISIIVCRLLKISDWFVDGMVLRDSVFADNLGLGPIVSLTRTELRDPEGPDAIRRVPYTERAEIRTARNNFRIGVYAYGAKMARYSRRRGDRLVFEEKEK